MRQVFPLAAALVMGLIVAVACQRSGGSDESAVQSATMPTTTSAAEIPAVLPPPPLPTVDAVPAVPTTSTADPAGVSTPSTPAAPTAPPASAASDLVYIESAAEAPAAEDFENGTLDLDTISLARLVAFREDLVERRTNDLAQHDGSATDSTPYFDQWIAKTDDALRRRGCVLKDDGSVFGPRAARQPHQP